MQSLLFKIVEEKLFEVIKIYFIVVTDQANKMQLKENFSWVQHWKTNTDLNNPKACRSLLSFVCLFSEFSF